MVRTVEELVSRMNDLMGVWHAGTRPGNDGDAGNTLEDLLEVPENNFKLPDFGEVEIKTQKAEGGSLLTLFHKEPKPGASVPRLLKCLGWRHQEAGARYPADEMSFRSTTYGHYYSVRGFRMAVVDGRIIFTYTPEQVNRNRADETGIFETYGHWADDVHARDPHHTAILPVYYDLEEVKEAFVTKLSHTLLVARKTKTEDGQKYHWYEEAYLMKEVRTDQIAPLIEEGVLAIDFDARTRHNHGTKFRIKKADAHRLFTDFRLME